MNSKLEKDAMRLAQELHDKKRELAEVKKQLKAVQKYVAELEKENKDGATSMSELYDKYLELKLYNVLESPRTCKGCKYYTKASEYHYENCSNYEKCIRWELHLPDYYEPKDTE